MRLLLISLLLISSALGAGVLSTQAGTPLLAGDWTQLVGFLGVVPTNNLAVGYDKAFWVPPLSAMCQHANGWKSISGEPNRSYICYSVAQNVFFVLDTTTNFHDDQMMDAGHSHGGVLSPDPTTGIWYGFCCESGSQAVEASRHTWIYDSLAQVGRDTHPGAGTPLSPTGTKPYINILLPSCSIAGSAGKLVCFGGATSQDVSTIEYTIATGAWAFNTATGPSNQLASASMAENSVDGKLYMVMGALGGVGGTGQNAVWTYAVSSQTWTKVVDNCTPSSTCPTTRLTPGWAFDPDDNVFVMHGGMLVSNGTTAINETWVFDPVGLTWTQLTTTHTPTMASPTFERFAYVPTHKAFVAFEGAGGANTMQVWALCYTACPNAGADQPGTYGNVYSQTAGQNRVVTASAPTTALAGTIAASGSTVYQAWDELGGTADSSVCKTFHPFAQSNIAGTVAQLPSPSGCLSIAGGGYANGGQGTTAGSGAGTTTFTIGGPFDFTSGCGGTCAGKKIWVQGLTQQTIATVTDNHHVVISATVPTSSGLAWIVLGAGTGTSGVGIFETAGSGITVVAGVPWIAFRMSSGNGNTWGNDGLDYLLAVGYSGGLWSLGGIVGKAGSATTWNQGPAQIIDVNGKPTLIVKQIERDTLPWHSRAYVFQFDGTFWNALGGALNLTGDSTHISYADSVALTTDGTNPIAVWTEYTTATAGSPVRMLDSAPQVRMESWNGSAWSEPCSGSANVTGTDAAYSVSVTYMGSQPYIAFQERTATGRPSLRVRTCSGGSWSSIGGAVVLDTNTGWAFAPSLTNDGTTLYLAWSEQGKTTTWNSNAQGSFGTRSQVFAAQWTGSIWAPMGGSLNMDTAYGSANHPSIVTVATGTPVVQWGETKLGYLRQVYSKQWSGTDWSAPSMLTSYGSTIGGQSRLAGSVKP